MNDIPILDVLSAAGISYRKDGGSANMYVMIHADWKTDTSFKINVSRNIVKDFWKTDIKGWPVDFIGRYVLNVDTQTDEGKLATIKWFVEKKLVVDEWVRKAFEKSLSAEELLKDFDSYKLWGFKEEVSRFLVNRWVPYDYIQKNHVEIGSIFKDIGYYDKFFCTEWETWKEDGKWITADEKDTPKTVAVLMFPCLDADWKRIGLKLRRVDGKTIRGQKSYAPSWSKTGLLFDKIDDKEAIIVEWETDYIILRVLGFKSVVWNLGWVSAHRDKLKSLLFSSSRVICLYDSDEAWLEHKQKLAESFGRAIYQIDLPLREDNKGNKLTDVNDLYGAGYDSKAKWDKLLKDAYMVWWLNNDQVKNSFRFAYLEWPMSYYDKKTNRPVGQEDISRHLWETPKELFKKRSQKVIEQFWDTCYYFWWKPNHLNILDETTIVVKKEWVKARLHPHIKLLIDNIGNWNEENIAWIHEAILYKLTHINDVNLPAMILFGAGWSGKWTFINLLSYIFGRENTLKNLGQRDLESSFDSYQGQKLIVEFQEISSGNIAQDKKMLDRIKSIVWEKTITVRALYSNAREVDNIAWFHFSSNHQVPIQLDSKDSGNRRFTIMQTGNMLETDIAVEMNRETFPNREIIEEYIAWLYETFPDTPEKKMMVALDNEDKRNLVNRTEGVGNLFFEWFELKYPNIWRINGGQMKLCLEAYRHENHDNEHNDARYKIANFEKSFSHKYEKKPVKIWGKAVRWYFIKKTSYQKANEIITGHPWEFTPEEWTKERAELNQFIAKAQLDAI